MSPASGRSVHLEMDLTDESQHLLFAESHANPRVGVYIVDRDSLNLKFEDSPRPQYPRSLTDVILNNRLPGYVLKDDVGKREIKRGVRKHRQVHAVVDMERHIRRTAECCPGAGDHLGADIDGIDGAHNLPEPFRQSSGATSYLQHPNVRRHAAPADQIEDWSDMTLERHGARLEEVGVIPVLSKRCNVVACVFAGTLVPVLAHHLGDLRFARLEQILEESLYTQVSNATLRSIGHQRQSDA